VVKKEASMEERPPSLLLNPDESALDESSDDLIFDLPAAAFPKPPSIS